MFVYKKSVVVSLIRRAVENTGDLTRVLTKNSGSGLSEVASRLQSTYENTPWCVVSVFAARMTATRVGPRAIELFRDALCVDPSIDGLFLEMWFLASLTSGETEYKWRGDRTKRTWNRVDVIFFDPKAAAVETITNHPGSWFAPTQGKHSGYDVFFVEPFERREWISKEKTWETVTRLRACFIQLTCAHHHDVISAPLSDMLTRLQENGCLVAEVELWFVVPDAIRSSFSHDKDEQWFQDLSTTPTGQDKPPYHSSSTVKGRIRVAGVPYTCSDFQKLPGAPVSMLDDLLTPHSQNE